MPCAHLQNPLLLGSATDVNGMKSFELPELRTVTLGYVSSKSSGAVLDLEWTKSRELCAEIPEGAQGRGCTTTNHGKITESEQIIWSFENKAFTSTIVFIYLVYLGLSIKEPVS